MNSLIGGYFELELPMGGEFHKNAIRLNTGRNAFEYILRARDYKKVFLPFYTCEAMLEPINKLGLEYEFYHIDEFFLPVFDFSIISANDAFVYNNYFGICDSQVSEVSKVCKNLIVDNSQAFFSNPLPGVDTFYSPRKFFGLPDGAYLCSDKKLNTEFPRDISYERCGHLLGRIDSGAEQFYDKFRENSKNLSGQPIKTMSNLTLKLLQSIDYNYIAKKRIENFLYLHNALKRHNKLDIKTESNVIPMGYPFLADNGVGLKKELIERKIFIATYWPNVFKWCDSSCYENWLAGNLLLLPTDQRYDESHIKQLLRLIL